MTALINGQSYSFVDIKLTLFGIECFSCTNLTAKETQPKPNNYGNSNKPVSRGRGKKEYEVSLDLSLKDVERLKAISPTGMLTDIPAAISNILLDNGVDAKHRFDLIAFEFSSDGIEAAEDDSEMKMSYDCICAEIVSTKLL